MYTAIKEKQTMKNAFYVCFKTALKTSAWIIAKVLCTTGAGCGIDIKNTPSNDTIVQMH